MAQNSCSGSSSVTECAQKEITWVLEGWAENHPILAAANASSPVVRLENGKVAFRYFLRPFETTAFMNTSTYYLTYYSLWVELLEVSPNCVVNVTASIPVQMAGYKYSHKQVGEFSTNNLQEGTKLVVIEDFIPVMEWCLNSGCTRTPTLWKNNSWQINLFTEKQITVTMTSNLFKLLQHEDHENVTDSIPGASSVSEQYDSQITLISDIKTLALSHEKYADLKLETKDNMTLSTSKFLFAARSPVFKTIVDEAIKMEDFDGTIKIPDVDAKPMMVILHWVYSGELHENASKCMEQILDASIKYKLNDLLRILDKKLVTICNTNNMFDMFQTAKKYGLPAAVENISAYIKENL